MGKGTGDIFSECGGLCCEFNLKQYVLTSQIIDHEGSLTSGYELDVQKKLLPMRFIIAFNTANTVDTSPDEDQQYQL